VNDIRAGDVETSRDHLLTLDSERAVEFAMNQERFQQVLQGRKILSHHMKFIDTFGAELHTSVDGEFDQELDKRHMQELRKKKVADRNAKRVGAV
jgi:hypothetical protein